MIPDLKPNFVGMSLIFRPCYTESEHLEVGAQKAPQIGGVWFGCLRPERCLVSASNWNSHPVMSQPQPHLPVARASTLHTESTDRKPPVIHRRVYGVHCHTKCPR